MSAASVQQAWERLSDEQDERMQGGAKDPQVAAAQSADEKNVVLLTGSTGALGAHILDVLLHDENVTHVYCLNRRENSLEIQHKRNADSKLPVDISNAKVTFLKCDLAKADFGLEASTFKKMASEVTIIIHNGWPVNFNLPLKSFESSLQGVLNINTFAVQAVHGPALLFVSSIGSVRNYTALTPGNQKVREDTMADTKLPTQDGYAQSKFIAERLIDIASQKYGLRGNYVRVGQIAGDSKTDAVWNKNEWFPSLIISSAHLGKLPSTLGLVDGQDKEIIDWLPIDVVAKGLVELASSEKARDGKKGAHVFHAVCGKTVSWSSLSQPIAETIKSAAGKEVEVVSWNDWLEALNDSQSELDDADDLENVLSTNPGLKLLSFYEHLNKTTTNVALEVTKTQAVSKTLRDAEAVRVEWVQKWVRGWVSN